MLVVIGHLNPDLDSVVSAIVEAKRLCLTGTAAQAFISGIPTKEVQALLEQMQLPLPAYWNASLANHPTALVDFNDLEQAPGELRNVIAITDHHHDCGDLPQVAAKLISPVGSTATLIASRFLAERATDLTRQDCLLLLAAIVSDTKQLLAPQTTDQDRSMAEQMAKQSGTSPEQMALQLQEFGCYHFSAELVPEYMTQSMKCNTINGHLVGSATIETLDLQPFLLHADQIIVGLQLLKGEIKALIVTDLQQQATALFHNGVLPLPSPYLMPGICQRKHEIRLLLEQHLH